MHKHVTGSKYIYIYIYIYIYTHTLNRSLQPNSTLSNLKLF